MRNAFLPSPFPPPAAPLRRKVVWACSKRHRSVEHKPVVFYSPLRQSLQTKPGGLCISPFAALGWPPAPIKRSLGRMENPVTLGGRETCNASEKGWAPIPVQQQPSYCAPGGRNLSTGFQCTHLRPSAVNQQEQSCCGTEIPLLSAARRSRAEQH